MPFRGFVALETGAPDSVVALLDELKALDADLKVVAPENLHVTVKFLGQIADDVAEKVGEAMVDVLAPKPPFPYHLRGVGSFPSRGSPRVVWAGIDAPPGLAGAVAELDERVSNLGFTPETRRFTPHLTLARARTPRGAERVRAFIAEHAEDDFATGTWTDAVLMRSDLSPRVPTYTVVRRVRFEGMEA